VRRRGSFDPSDYNFSSIVVTTGELIRASSEPLDLSSLARLVGRASGARPGDALRAAYQIEGHEDRDRGWELLAEQAVKIMERSRVVRRDEAGFIVWLHEGDEPVTFRSGQRRFTVLSPADRERTSAESVRQYRLETIGSGNLYSGPLFDPEQGNLPGRLFDAEQVDTRELRESLLTFGYVPQLPILVDEKGMILSGFQRERLCEQLRAEFPERTDLVPTRQVLTLGDGAEANASRLRIAIAANVGRRPLSTETKRRIAAYLYDEREWSYPQIAEALNITMEGARKLAPGRRRQGTKSGGSLTNDPAWQSVVDPLIERWEEGEMTGEEIVDELKSRGMKGHGFGTITQRRDVLRAQNRSSDIQPSSKSEDDPSDRPLPGTIPDKTEVADQQVAELVEEFRQLDARIKALPTEAQVELLRRLSLDAEPGVVRLVLTNGRA
jgi:hypothetical protein